jgi:hypothetical protein
MLFSILYEMNVFYQPTEPTVDGIHVLFSSKRFEASRYMPRSGPQSSVVPFHPALKQKPKSEARSQSWRNLAHCIEYRIVDSLSNFSHRSFNYTEFQLGQMSARTVRMRLLLRSVNHRRRRGLNKCFYAMSILVAIFTFLIVFGVIGHRKTIKETSLPAESNNCK